MMTAFSVSTKAAPIHRPQAPSQPAATASQAFMSGRVASAASSQGVSLVMMSRRNFSASHMTIRLRSSTARAVSESDTEANVADMPTMEDAQGSDEGSESSQSSVESDTAFVGNLTWNTTDDDLLAHFQSHSPKTANVIIDNYSGQSRGYGYVTFESVTICAQAIESMNDSELGGRNIRCEAKGATQRRKNPISSIGRGRMSKAHDGEKVYLGNLAWELENEDLIDLCSRFGTVKDANIVIDKETGLSKGFGFVSMANEEEANNLVAELDELNVNGRYLKASIAAQKAASSQNRITIGERRSLHADGESSPSEE